VNVEERWDGSIYRSRCESYLFFSSLFSFSSRFYLLSVFRFVPCCRIKVVFYISPIQLEAQTLQKGSWAEKKNGSNKRERREEEREREEEKEKRSIN
jgi:hypothetical protein